MDYDLQTIKADVFRFIRNNQGIPTDKLYGRMCEELPHNRNQIRVALRSLTRDL